MIETDNILSLDRPGPAKVEPHPARLGGDYKAAYRLVMIFVLIYFLRPEDWVPGAAAFPMAKIIGGLAILALVVGFSKTGRAAFPKSLKLIVGLFAIMCFGVPFSIWRSGSIGIAQNFLNIVLVATAAASALNSFQRLQRLVCAHAIGVLTVTGFSILQFRSGIMGSRMTGSVGGVLANSNDLALNVVLVLPFCFFFLLRARTVLRKTFWAVALLLVLYGTLQTGSRGGLICLFGTAAYILISLGLKQRRLLPIVLVIIAILIFVLAAPSTLERRLSSTFNAHDDESAYASSEQRQQLLRKSFSVAISNPLIGVGAGNFELVSGVWRVSHNSFAQVASELGLPALLLFLLLFRNAWSDAGTNRYQGVSLDIKTLGSSFRGSLIALLLGAWFVNFAYHYYVYYIFIYCSALASLPQNEA